MQPGVAAVISIGNVLEPLLGAWLLTRKGDFDLSLSAPRDYFRLCYLGGLISPFICALTGVGVLMFSGYIAANDFWHEFAHWWMGDTLGIVVVAPLVLVWRQLPRRRHVADTVVLFALSFVIGQILFLGWFHDVFGPYSRGYWIYLLISWAAVRLGRRIARAVAGLRPGI